MTSHPHQKPYQNLVISQQQAPFIEVKPRFCHVPSTETPISNTASGLSLSHSSLTASDMICSDIFFTEALKVLLILRLHFHAPEGVGS